MYFLCGCFASVKTNVNVYKKKEYLMKDFQRIGIYLYEAIITFIIYQLSANSLFVSAIWKNCEIYSNKLKSNIWLCYLQGAFDQP